jgi:hypothetical protein
MGLFLSGGFGLCAQYGFSSTWASARTMMRRPVLLTLSRIASLSSGEAVRGVDDRALDAFLLQHLGSLIGELHHAADGDDGGRMLTPSDSRRTAQR